MPRLPILLIGHNWMSRGPVELPPPRPEQNGRPRSIPKRAPNGSRRERKVAAGIDELDRWLRDLMRRGLDSTRSEGYRFWDAMGARLVDAQAGGLGRSVRGLGSAANSGDAWPHLLLEGVGRLHLLSEAYRRADRSPMSCGQTSARWSAGT